MCLKFLVVGGLPFYSDGHAWMAILGAVSSLFAPCIIINDFSDFYLRISLTSTISYGIILIVLPILVYYDVRSVLPIGSIGYQEEFKLFNNSTLPMFNNEELIFSHPFYQFITALTILTMLSIIVHIFFHQYIDVMFRLKVSSFIHDNIASWYSPIWPSKDLVWLPFVNQILANPTEEELQKIDKRTDMNFKSSLLEFCCESGNFSLTKVIIDSILSSMILGKISFQSTLFL